MKGVVGVSCISLETVLNTRLGDRVVIVARNISVGAITNTYNLATFGFDSSNGMMNDEPSGMTTLKPPSVSTLPVTFKTRSKENTTPIWKPGPYVARFFVNRGPLERQRALLNNQGLSITYRNSNRALCLQQRHRKVSRCRRREI